MRKIFLTSGLVLCLACPAFADIAAGTSSANCNESTLGSAVGPVDFDSDWRPMISGSITIDSGRYRSNNGSEVQSATSDANPSRVYAVYGVGCYNTEPTVGTIGNFTTSNRLTALSGRPSMTGYDFAGVYTTKVTGGTQVIDSSGNFIYNAASTQFSTESESSDWYVRWTPKKYNVVYNSRDCSTTQNQTVYTDSTSSGGATYGQNYTIPEAPDDQMALMLKTGYTLNGWTASSQNRTTADFPDSAATPWSRTDNLTVYAVCSPKNYTITYNAGAHGTGSVSYTGASNGGLTYDSTWTTKSFAQTGFSAATGWVFSKWNTASDGSGADYNANTAQSAWTTDGGLTLYAIYAVNTKTISYSCGSGASGSGPSNGSAVHGSAYTLSSGYGDCALTGHTATGWDCSGGATLTNATGNQAASTWSSDANISCTVHWTPNKYSVRYNSRSCSSTPNQDVYTDSTSNGGGATYGQDYTIPEEMAFLTLKTGYTLNGWTADSSNTTTANFPDSAATPWSRTTGLTVYAVCSPSNYTITYNGGAHGTGSVSYTGVSNGGLTYESAWTTKSFAQTGLSANSGYRFIKWNTAADGSGTDYSESTAQSVWMNNSGLTLYAIYELSEVSITYGCGTKPSGASSNVSGNGPSSGTATYGAQYGLAESYGTCSLPGYHPSGWDCSGGATLTNATGNQAASTWNSMAGISCDVHWVANTINLNYYQDSEASTPFTTSTCTYDTTFNLPSNYQPKNGYHFNGWIIRN